MLAQDEKSPVRVAYGRRNRDLVRSWSGAARTSRTGEASSCMRRRSTSRKVHPKVLIDDLRRQSEQRRAQEAREQQGATVDLFADFNGLPSRPHAPSSTNMTRTGPIA
ncbi:MAG: hypothetical protein R3F22_04700 [Lysobacteraceae bacterium]